MGRRYFEVEAASSEESWREIRAFRSRASEILPESRLPLLWSSLEQAEQQCRAASQVGFESRALNLYYGISQAGRAISAVLTRKGSGMSPEVRGHGLGIPGLDQMKALDLFALQIRGDADSNSSYGRLAGLTRSDSLNRPVPLGAIWNMIPELALDYPIEGYPSPRFVTLPSGRNGGEGEVGSLAVQATSIEADNDFEVLRSMYPRLNSVRLERYGGSSYGLTSDGSRTEEAVFTWEADSPLHKIRNSHVLMPAWCDGAEPLDPFLAWWVLLYTLSMVTRYRPVEWTKIVNVDRSKLAVPIEIALEKGLDAVPDQLHTLLTETLSPGADSTTIQPL